MPFTASDLRYEPEQSYPVLYAYLQRHAQRHLGSLMYDAVEVDMVVSHVVEQLVKLGIFGAGNTTPKNALDRLSDAQFYAFLNTSVKNKAIDRLRKRRLPVSNVTDLEAPGSAEGEDNPMNDAVESVWGIIPFDNPEEIALHLASQLEMRSMLKHCIMTLEAAPRQLQAIIHELQELGANDLLLSIQEELYTASSITSSPSSHSSQIASSPTPHISQHKDHAHKKLRHCLQQQSTNLIVIIALRLTEYSTHSPDTNEYTTDVQTLVQHDLTEDAVRNGLYALVTEKLLTWNGEATVKLTPDQMKHLNRYYREE